MSEVLEIIYHLLLDEKEYYSPDEYKQLLASLDERRSEVLQPLIYIELAQSSRHILKDIIVVFGLKSFQRNLRYFISVSTSANIEFDLIKDKNGNFSINRDNTLVPGEIEVHIGALLEEYRKWIDDVVKDRQVG
ncbi:MAG: hypothetical protein JSS82_10915 [Bacteroidetes bacterium]|nr:hypothetical protein [Bacteroidota bacterium]